MANGGHIISSSSGAQVFHWEEGVGMGRFPKAIPGTPSFFSQQNYDVLSLDKIWVGCFVDSANADPYVAQWDGSLWTLHNIPRGGGPDEKCLTTVSVYRDPVPTNPPVVFIGGDYVGGPGNWFWKYQSGSFSPLRAYTTAYNDRFVPLALSATECIWISGLAHSGNPGYWVDHSTQYTGTDLPAEGFAGICIDGEGTIFLLSASGNVYRATNKAGPWTLDNPSSSFGSGFSHHCSMACSTDGNTIVVQKDGTNYYVRNGPDDWVDVGPTNIAGTQGQPAAVDRQTLVAGASNQGKISFNGGSTWVNAQGGNIGNLCNGCLIAPKSSTKRIIAAYQQKSNPIALWWKGDSEYSPWARWDSYKTAPDGVTAFSTNFNAVQGFDTGHIVLAIATGGLTDNLAWHYNPISDSWTVYYLATLRIERLCGTEYAAGRIHGVGQSTTLYYFRWTGSGYTATAIPGSTASGNTNISASADGEDIWISAGGSQLWHSSNGGSTWVNRFAAASAVHTGAGTIAADVIVVSPTEVWVAIETAGGFGGCKFSKWNGSAWSVAAPDLSEYIATGNKGRVLLRDSAGSFWAFTVTNTGAIYKLVTGSWVLQDQPGQQSRTGIAALDGNTVMATSADLSGTGNRLDADTPANGLGWLQGIVGSNNLPNTFPWVDVTPWDITTPPVLQNQDPAPSETGVAATKQPYLEIVDNEEDLDLNSVILVANWVSDCGGQYATVVYQESTFKNGWSGTVEAIAKGYGWTLIPPDGLPWQATITIEVYAEDTYDPPNVLDTGYSFSTAPDAGSPTIEFDPADGSVDVPKYGPITVKLRDTQSGINLDATLITVNFGRGTETIFNRRAGGFPIGYRESTVTEVEGGYDIAIVADRAKTWRDTDNIYIAASTADCVGNPVSANAILTAVPRLVPKIRDYLYEQLLIADGLDPEGPYVYPQPEESEEEEGLMSSPKVTWVDADSVQVEPPLTALGNAVNYKLQGGFTYPLNATPQTCDLGASGVGGLDTGVRSNNKWYHLYLVPVGEELKPIFSLSDPSTGPSGYTRFLPIMVVFNGNAGEIAEFDVAGSLVHIRQMNDQPRIFSLAAAGATVNTWFGIPLDDASQTIATATGDGWVIEGGPVVPTNFPGFPMSVIDQVQVMGFLDEDSGASEIYVRGGLAKPTEVVEGSWGTGGNPLLDSNASTSGHMILNLPNADLYWYCRGGGTLDMALRIVSFRHKYRI